MASWKTRWLVPFMIFVATRRVRGRLTWKLAFAFVLGGLQGALGWYMVKSGLGDDPRVNHYRLAAHLALALWLLVYLWLVRLDLGTAKTWPTPRHLHSVALAFLVLLCIQIMYGAFTAGLDAGYIYNTFPKMNGMWIPLTAFGVDSGLRDLLDNPATVQFLHRVLGTLALIGVFTLWIYGQAFSLSSHHRIALRAIPLLTFLQFGLGVATLLMHVPVSLAVAHQVNAALMLCAVATLVHKPSTRLASPA